MFMGTSLALWKLIMASLQQLDPSLLAFWEGFPCPPPWNQELLFRLNWTGCMEIELGHKVRLYLADRCHIRPSLDPPLEREEDRVLVEQECGLTCRLVAGAVTSVFLLLLAVTLVVCVRRQRTKPSSPSHQSSLTSHSDNAKYYTSCHYACAPVLPRQLQTTLNGDRPQTSLLPSKPSICSTTNDVGRYAAYLQHKCQQLTYHPHQHPHGRPLQSTPCLIMTPYGQVPAHTSTIIVPQHPRYAPGGLYSKYEPNYSSCSAATTSDRSPVYETISNRDSLQELELARSQCQFCQCSDHHSRLNTLPDGLGPTLLLPYSESGSVCLPQATEDPPGPCPPMFGEGFYSDVCRQTLPLRPLRAFSENHQPPGTESGVEAGQFCATNSSHQTEPDSNEQHSDRRRRPSSASCSSSSSQYMDGSRRVIPALHPHYFVSSHEQIS